MAGLAKKYFLTMLIHINLMILLIFFSICLIEDLEPLMLLKISPETIATKAVAFLPRNNVFE
jgi:hypothetical protein